MSGSGDLNDEAQPEIFGVEPYWRLLGSWASVHNSTDSCPMVLDHEHIGWRRCCMIPTKSRAQAPLRELGLCTIRHEC